MSSRTVTPEEYSKLTSKEALGWAAVYKGYKDKKIRVKHICDCNHCDRKYDGWETIKIPVGEPLYYKWHKPTWADEMAFYWSENMLKHATQDLIIFND